MARKKLTEKEKMDWDALYTYVKNLLGYDENQALSSTMVLRLKGLLTNKFIENGNIADTANYSYEVILNTFKFCSPQIKKALQTNSFKSEQHKFLYITKIVENNINEVYIRMKQSQKAKKDAENIDISHTVEYVNTFKNKEKKTNNRLNELW